MTDPVLIWSNEHCAWWRTARLGYTEHFTEAGWYERAEALEICRKANEFLRPGEIHEEIREISSEAHGAIPIRIIRDVVSKLQNMACDLSDDSTPFNAGVQLGLGYAAGAILKAISEHGSVSQ